MWPVLGTLGDSSRAGRWRTRRVRVRGGILALFGVVILGACSATPTHDVATRDAKQAGTAPAPTTEPASASETAPSCIDEGRYQLVGFNGPPGSGPPTPEAALAEFRQGENEFRQAREQEEAGAAGTARAKTTTKPPPLRYERVRRVVFGSAVSTLRPRVLESSGTRALFVGRDAEGRTQVIVSVAGSPLDDGRVVDWAVDAYYLCSAYFDEKGGSL